MNARKKREKYGRKRKRPNWGGVVLESSKSVKGKSYLIYGGYRYCTYGEMELARLLDEQGIPFTPDVEFHLIDDDPNANRSEVDYVPDFIFDKRTCLWVMKDGSSVEIHGLEVKATPPTKGYMPSRCHPLGHRLFKKQVLLYEQRGILVPVVSDAEVEFWTAEGGLPVRSITRNKT